MDELQKQLQETWQLIKNKEYEAVDEKLPDAILEKYNNAELYAEKASACYYLKQHERAKNYAEVAIQLDKNCTAAYNTLGNLYYDKKDYNSAEQCFKKALEVDPNYVHAHNGLGNIYYDKKDYKSAELYYKKAIEVYPNYVHAYNSLGNIYYNKRDYKRAELCYEKALRIDPNYVHAYYNLGFLFYEKKDNDRAVEFYKKAIEVDPNYVDTYNNLGILYKDKNDVESAEEYYKQALKLDPKYIFGYLNLGDLYEINDNIEKAIDIYRNGLSIAKEDDEQYINYLKEKINELYKQLLNTDYRVVSKCVNVIKELLEYKGKSITHYTSLSTSRLLILEDSPIRISEATFLNDTSEGTVLFDFLEIDTEHSAHNKNALANIPFVKKPFIGSFVPDAKCNDLILWRMYGKENNEEAKGFAITIDSERFLDEVKDQLLNNNPNLSLEDDFKLYKVVYKLGSGDDAKFIMPSNEEASEGLKILMQQIKERVNHFNRDNTKKLTIQDMRELLNRIAYLFKNAEYQYEHEVRLIVRDVRLKREIDKGNATTLPRVFIKLININPYISRITIGPKVANKEEWAYIFYYHLQEKQANEDLKIQVSCLPFK